MNPLKSIRYQLTLWFVGSLISLALFFYFVIHIFMWPSGEVYFVVLIILLGLIGSWLIYRVTASLTRLTTTIASISDKNLDQRITGLEGENEMGRLARAFNELLDRIHQAFERERQFIGDVAHELKTPLAVLSGTLENALTKDRSPEEYREVLAKSLDESRRLSSTFNNLLDLAWSEAPPKQQSNRRTNLSQLLTEVAEIAQGLAEAKAITVQQHLAESIYCTGNKDKLARAILNVIDNAIKFAPKNSHVTIRLEQQAGRALIHIEDEGPGIKAPERERIFERFYRSDVTNTTPGTGLGLALTKSIIRLHHGHIVVAPNTPQGSIFTITIPVTTSSS
jgi:two-component system heavy metal sensor histidine kinase CusS